MGHRFVPMSTIMARMASRDRRIGRAMKARPKPTPEPPAPPSASPAPLPKPTRLD
jgi:hypothetical protein